MSPSTVHALVVLILAFGVVVMLSNLRGPKGPGDL
jgi:hypothetical protein